MLRSIAVRYSVIKSPKSQKRSGFLVSTLYDLRKILKNEYDAIFFHPKA